MLDLLSTSPLLISLSLTLLHFLWQGLLVALVLKSALLLFNNSKPQLRYALSALAMSANFVLPIITFIIIYQTESLAASTLANSLALSEFIQELKQPNAFFSYNELTALIPSLLPSVAIFWLATITLLSGKLLLEMYQVNNLPQQNTVDPSEKLQARFNELANQINLTIRPRLLISLKIDVPMAIGWLKPVVLLPVNMVSGLSTSQLEMLLLHELAHIRRHDYLVNFFQTVVEILLFFHPCVHWVSKQMRNEREYCSDDIAVQHCGDAVAYAHTLADTASLCSKAHHHTIPNMAMAASGGDLKQRVIRLVDHHCAPQNNISKWLASAIIIFSVLLLSSKQLLTMPLLDIWYSEKPLQHPTNTTEKAQKKNIYTDNNITSNIIPNSAIAQQFLTHQTNKLNIASITNLKTPLTTHTPSNSTPSIAQLINLPVETSQSSNLSTELITLATPTVEQAFERNNTQNELSLVADPNPKDIEKLAISPLTKTAKAKQITTNKDSHSLIVVNSYSDNNKKNDLFYINNKNKINSKFVDHTSRQKEELVQPIIIANKSIVPLSPVWQSAEQVKKVVPIYPSVAERKGIEINVKVDFTIDVDGQIKNIKFAQHKKINYFKKSIRTAIEKWRFLPAKVDEKPVESQMAKVFSFSLQG